MLPSGGVIQSVIPTSRRRFTLSGDRGNGPARCVRRGTSPPIKPATVTKTRFRSPKRVNCWVSIQLRGGNGQEISAVFPITEVHVGTFRDAGSSWEAHSCKW